jgi:hypothetical protein
MIQNKLSILEQFKNFYSFNNPKTLELAIDYFTIFGGVKIYAPTDVAIEELIKEKILDKYKYLRNEISAITMEEQNSHKILTALALGDRRTNSAFRKTNISFNEGIEIVDKLCARGMLSLEKSRQSITNLPRNNDISEKLLFTTPFARFWFAFISPLYKGIKEQDYKEFSDVFSKAKGQFSNLVFEQLSHEVVKKSFVDDGGIVNIGRYWDDKFELTIVAVTKSGKTIIGSSKYTNSKVKKSELSKLKQIANELGIKVDTYVLFSKKGFSGELKSLKGDNLKLFTPRNFKILLD